MCIRDSRESKRRVAPAEARAMRQAIAPMVDVVALFRDNTKEEVREVLRTVRPTLLQFHGDEDESFCRSFNMPYLKAVAMGGKDEVNARQLQLRYPSAAGFLFDSHAPGGGGGTGVAFDWTRLPTGLHRPFLLAGGITPDNVFDAIVATLPWANTNPTESTPSSPARRMSPARVMPQNLMRVRYRVRFIG